MAPPAIYRQRRPRESALYQCLEQYWEEFKQAYTLFYEKDYGPLRRVVERTVERFLECGILRHGFARIRCGYRHEEYLPAFSRKTRYFCPSRRAKRVAVFVESITEEIREAVDHRQLVRTLPRVLRPTFRRDRQGRFQPFGPLDSEVLTRLFQHHVLEMLTSQRRLSRDFADRLRCWRPSGFQVYCGPPVDRDDQPALERLSAYIPRPSFAGSRLQYQSETAAIPTPRAARDVNKVSRHPGRPPSTAPRGQTRPPNVWLGNVVATGPDS